MGEAMAAAAARPAAMEGGNGGQLSAEPDGPAPREETLTTKRGENKL